MDDTKDPEKILMADDDKDDQELFKEAVSKTNIPAEVTTVDNGKELMKNLKDESQPNPDIIFLDINMPLKNGRECLEEIKNDENLKDIPTVIYTTSTDDKDIKDTFKTGANLYLAKPNSFNALVLLLKKIFTLKWTGTLLKPLWNTFFISEKNISKK